MFKYIGLLGAVLAGLAYYFLQNAPISFQLKKFISHEPSLVFKFLKDPTYLTDLHPNIRNVFIESLKVSDSNVEHRQFIVTEDIPHIGLQNISVTTVSDPNSLEITSKALFMRGMFPIDMTYRLMEAWNGTIAGTSIEESTTLYFPYILIKFVNRTAMEAHAQTLNNLEMLMEFAAGNESEDVFVDRTS